MPIYEYRCDPCNLTFESLLRSQSDVPHCPNCGAIELSKLLSIPAAAQSANQAGSSLPICESTGSRYACGPGECRTGLCRAE